MAVHNDKHFVLEVTTSQFGIQLLISIMQSFANSSITLCTSDESHTPREWRTSQCLENGSWAPDPALLNCALGVSPV